MRTGIALGLYGNGYTTWIQDELELGARVACFLDSENNTPDIHFVRWDACQTTA